MSSQIMWVCTFGIDPKRFGEVNDTLDALTSASLEEPGCADYQYFFNGNKTELHIIEAYRNSEAVVTHVNHTFSKFSEKFGELTTAGSFTVYGQPEGEARRILDGFGATYLSPAPIAS
ncbi:antibiotic biosynthesis monooxygenase [Brucella pseudogrignonensis]|uniref:putative quinol monooxygenase n=1 Tax=Brucella pseudogrignonensis TaxID=419475 RepID=UPI0028B2C62D|nr:antibiotic biosynthesis monooxygenase [Brucella pseudogrignonensis]MDT6942557.1 antibiotic biosynthesis monooxygenase [Brucella pseudogrignonensis]